MRNNFLLALMAALGGGTRKTKLTKHQLREYKEERKLTRNKRHGTKNKSQGESDIRKKMAKESNRINRDRIKKWKH